MRRFLVLIATTALCFVSGVLFSSAQADGGEDGAIVSNHTISDSFEGTSISPKVWGFYGTNQPNNVTLTQKDEGLYVSVSSTATNDFTGGLTTRCKLRGDFDAILSFRLVTWPPKNGVWLSLLAADTGGFNVYRVSWQFDTGDDYGAYLPPAGAIAPASGNSGVLRLSRQAGYWTAYYLSGGSWVTLASAPGPTSDVALNPSVFNLSGVLPYGGAATTVAFKGFHAIAAAVVCPN
jgi:hypothetical protein